MIFERGGRAREPSFATLAFFLHECAPRAHSLARDATPCLRCLKQDSLHLRALCDAGTGAAPARDVVVVVVVPPLIGNSQGGGQHTHMPPRKRAARPPPPPPAARAQRGAAQTQADASPAAAVADRPPPLINPATGAPFVGVAFVPPARLGDPLRFHGWAVPGEGRRASVGKRHASAAAAARARDRAAIAIRGRAAFEGGGGGGGGGRAQAVGRAPSLNFPLASYPPADDFQRTGAALASFLKALAKSGDSVVPPHPRPAARSRCGACDACRRPWLKRPCTGKRDGGRGGGKGGGARPAAGTRPPRAGPEVAGPVAPVDEAAAAAAAAAHADAVTTEAVAALADAAQATARAVRLPPGAPLDPALADDPYAPTAPSLEGWAHHDYGADLAAVGAAAAAGRPVFVPRPGALARKREGGGAARGAAGCALCGASWHSLATCPMAGVALAVADERGEEEEERTGPPLLRDLAAAARGLAARGDPWGGGGGPLPPLPHDQAVAAAAVALEAGLAVLAAGVGVVVGRAP